MLARHVVNFKVLSRRVVSFKVLSRRVVNFKVLLRQAEAILVCTSAGSCACETLVVFSAGLCLVWAGSTHP